MAYQDKTLTDNNRQLLNLHRPEIGNVLPEWFATDNPKLLTLFEKYYEWMDSDKNPNDRIKQLYSNRDATQVPDELLQYLEDELLLGQAYFGGFQNKREAIKFSNTLYRSKGTKYSIQQFFRGFFGEDPEIIYPKDQVFLVGPKVDYELDSDNDAGGQIRSEASVIGPESRKFITDDKLYQTLSILIRIGIPVSQWRDVYKLFVHPAGMYLGSELVLISSNQTGISTIQEEVGTPIEELIAAISEASLTTYDPISSVTLINTLNNVEQRQIEQQTIEMYQNLTVEELQTGYDNIGDFLTPNSATFDESDGGASIRDFATFSDSSYDSAGIISDDLIKKQSFDLHKFDTEYDSDWS